MLLDVLDGDLRDVHLREALALGRHEHDGQAGIAGVAAAAAQVDVARADALAFQVPQHHAALDALLISDHVAALAQARREQRDAVQILAARMQPLLVADHVALRVLDRLAGELLRIHAGAAAGGDR